MSEDMLHVMEWHNGDKDYSPFSDQEMKRRQDELRAWMAKQNVDAALFIGMVLMMGFTAWHLASHIRALFTPLPAQKEA